MLLLSGVRVGFWFCTVLNKIMGWTRWDVELSQPNHGESITHRLFVGSDAAASPQKHSFSALSQTASD